MDAVAIAGPIATPGSLIEAVTNHAIADVGQVISSSEPESGEPTEALQRVLSAASRG
jgi:hypothetical protein